MDNTDLIKKFGGKKIEESYISSNADLIKKFGNGTVKAEAPTESDILTGPPTPEKFEQSKVIAAETEKALASKPVEWSKFPVVRHGIKGFKEGGELASSGWVDMSRGLPASGVGKAVLGHTTQALNVLPVLPAIEFTKEELNKFGSNVGDRLIETTLSGLPFIGATKAVIKSMPSTRAVKTIAEAIGPENIPTVVKHLQSNPRLTLTDVDPNIQIITQGLAAKVGEPRNILDKFVNARKDTKLDTVIGALDEAMGIPVNIKNKIDDLKKLIKDTGKEINPVVASIDNVDITPVVKHIDEKLKPGVQSVISMGEPLPLEDIQKGLKNLRQFLTDDKSFRTDAKSLHNFQSALRAKAEDLLSSTNGQHRQLGYALMNVRNQVVNAIDIASGGTYKSKLAKYRDVNDIDQSFKKGLLITKNRLGNLDDDPSYWEAWIKNATEAEKEAAREGARLTVAQQMGAARDAARKGIDVPLIEFNKEKLKLLFGKDEIEKMAEILANERKIADTNSKLMQGSMTAMRLLGAEATKVRPDFKTDFNKTMLPVALEAGHQYLTGGNLLPLGMISGITYPYIRGKMTKVGQALDHKTNIEITNLVTATGKARENLIKTLQNYVPQSKLSLAQKSVLALPISKP